MVKIFGGRSSWSRNLDEESSDTGGHLGEMTEAQKDTLAEAKQKLADVLAYSDSSTASEAWESAENEFKPPTAWADEEPSENQNGSFTEQKSAKGEKRKRGIKAPVETKVKSTLHKPRNQRKRTIPTAKSIRKQFGEETDEDEDMADDDDATMGNGPPDQLKRRRRETEKRNMARLEDAGVVKPPSYDDVDFSDDERMSSLKEKPVFHLAKPCAPYKDIPLPYSPGVIPAPVAQWLKEYQVQGAAFLHELFAFQKGGILGDDMGLGKTIQVIAALTAAFGKTGDERDAKRMRKIRRAVGSRWYPCVLIICPGGLMENWKYELQKWGWWSIYTFHGSTQDKESALQAAISGRLEIMITTYTTYKLNKESINQVAWDCVVADECHIIKERKAEVTQAMDEVNALCRLGLTGTAIQNRYEELWTLLNWANPGAIGSLSSWKSSISGPLRLGQAHDATTAELSKARKIARKLVDNLLPQFFLRRMKTLIADQLPKKTDRVVFCPLTSAQADAYENFIESDQVQYIRNSTESCDCGSGKARGWCCYTHLPDGERWQAYVFPAINTLRNLSNHIGLLIPSSINDKARLNKELDTLQAVLPHDWEQLYRDRDNIVTLANRQLCGKWLVLNKLLRFWYNKGDKVLVFSYSVRLLKLLQVLFTNTEYNVSYLDGSMSYQERTRVVEDFNADPSQFVFLISTRAGGVGLNITSANKVVVVDPNWNPSYDLQAQDRAYRIGQTRNVEVFRLVSVGTIEEIVYARQIYKQAQANIGYTASLERRYFKGVQENSEKKGEIFGLKNLLSYQGENIVLRDIVNRTNIAESRAGVSVVGVDLKSENNEQDNVYKGKEEGDDAAISQLADLISKGNASEEGWEKKMQQRHGTDAIQGILAGAGVEYTHANAEVIGSSRIETCLSLRAEQMGQNNDDEQVFANSQSQSLDHSGSRDTSDIPFRSSNTGGLRHNADDDGSNDQGGKEQGSSHNIGYRWRPPEEIRRRQFCTMAKTFGYEDVTQFALAVEGWSQSQRRGCLDRFYEMLRSHEVVME